MTASMTMKRRRPQSAAPFGAVWGLATLGMIASVVAWLDMALAGGRQAAAGAAGGAARAPAVA